MVLTFIASLGRSSLPRRSSTQTSLSDFGVTMQGKNPANGDSVDDVKDSANDISKHPVHVRKMPAKYKDGDTRSGVQASKIRRTDITTDDEDRLQPRKKKPKTKIVVEDDLEADTDQVSPNKGPNTQKTHVFSQASEDAQNTRANTGVSSWLDDSGNASTGEMTTEEGRCLSDEEEWGYSQLDKMVTKDAQVRTHITPKLCRLTIEYADSPKAQSSLKHRERYPNHRPGRHLHGWQTSRQ
jgi:hypothetical protein